MPSDAIDEDKQNAIYEFALAASGITVIWDKPGAPRPAVPYVTLNVSSGPRKVGTPEVKYGDVQDTFTYPMRKEITLTINSYADSGWLATLGKIIDSLDLPTKQQILRDAGLAIINSEDPVDISALLNDQYEGRGSVDIMLGYCDSIEDVSGEVESVNFDQTIGTFESNQTIGG
jgi:hypothetical protein